MLRSTYIVSFCSLRNTDIIYAVQQDKQSVLTSEFYSTRMLTRHVSDLTGPSSGAFYKLYLQILYVVLLCVLLDTSSRYEQLDVSSSTRITTYQSLQIQLLQNAPDDGPMRSETCRANIRVE